MMIAYKLLRNVRPASQALAAALLTGNGCCTSHTKALQQPLQPLRAAFLEASKRTLRTHTHSREAWAGASARTLQRSIERALTESATRAGQLVPLRSCAGFSKVSARTVRDICKGVPDRARRHLVVWLGSCTAWVYSMVVIGGLTRLTRSGLSMTDWKFSGETPPLTEDDWIAEFRKYQQSPEYKRVNRGMSLDEFKFIYWMEFAHRSWGRILGLLFLCPAVYFTARGYITRPLAVRLAALFLMGGTQGFVGWWMVKSGLEEPEGHQAPRVSPYRLAAHLGSAFTIYATLLWTTLSVAKPTPNSWAGGHSPAVTAGASFLRRTCAPLAGLIALTALSGAFVAGLDAGHAYNTFPLMDGRLVPEEYWAVGGWRNAFENTAAVQFHHRALALGTLTAVALTAWRHGGAPLAAAPRRALQALTLATAAQVALGISALLTHVPPALGAAHQANALLALTCVVTLLHTLRPVQGLSFWFRFSTPALGAVSVVSGAALLGSLRLDSQVH